MPVGYDPNLRFLAFFIKGSNYTKEVRSVLHPLRFVFNVVVKIVTFLKWNIFHEECTSIVILRTFAEWKQYALCSKTSVPSAFPNKEIKSKFKGVNTITRQQEDVIIKRNFQRQKKLFQIRRVRPTWLIKITMMSNMVLAQCVVFTCCKALFTLFFSVTGIVKLSFVTTPLWPSRYSFTFLMHNARKIECLTFNKVLRSKLSVMIKNNQAFLLSNL